MRGIIFMGASDNRLRTGSFRILPSGISSAVSTSDAYALSNGKFLSKKCLTATSTPFRVADAGALALNEG